MDTVFSEQQGGVSVSTNEVEGDKLDNVSNEVVKLKALNNELNLRVVYVGAEVGVVGKRRKKKKTKE